MHRFSTIGAVTLIFLISVMPVLACMQPGASLTAEERECCKKMSGDCGTDMMNHGSSSHSCCEKAVNVGVGKAVVPNFQSFQQLQHQDASYSETAIELITAPDASSLRILQAMNNGPPGPAVSVSILRI